MSDIIRLLPDSVANQIAAGEVIQRPASALKELLENSVDAGANDIKVIIKDAGKTLIQIIDNGSGMSEKDATLCFERHATSKIQDAKDLFSIRTLGFRGEALASIAAIAQVELRTKQKDEELGFCINIEGSEIKSNKACSCSNGTTVSVKNLFFNVPARRNFLKSNTAELRHIIEEFQRVSLVNNNISMSLINNDKSIFQLNSGTLYERIIAIFGGQFKERLIPVEQQTSEVSITGYIGKPEFAKKTRGEQYFFCNKRFIKHPYLNHSVNNAFQELIPEDAFPAYFIYLEIDPRKVDVNIHPTKTEVNFQDNHLIYAILKSCIKQSLGKFNVTPSLDFEQELSLDLDFRKDKDKPIKNPFYKKESNYNPFEGIKSKGEYVKPTSANWTEIYKGLEKAEKDLVPDIIPDTVPDNNQNEEPSSASKIFQIKGKYLLTQLKSGVIIIDQNKANERILYEKFLKLLNDKQNVSQQELFPENITLSISDADLLKEIEPQIEILGFKINQLNKNTFIINGSPSGSEISNYKDFFEGLLESYKQNMLNSNLDDNIIIARSMAKRMALAYGKTLKYEEMEGIISDLFACQTPEYSPDGTRIVKLLNINEIDELFRK